MAGYADRFFHVIRDDGTLWAAGSGASGRLGVGDTAGRTTLTQVGTATTWKQVACGKDHAAAVQSDGSLWAWGNNENGQLGLGDTTNRLEPALVGQGYKFVACATWMSFAIKTDGSLWACGWNSNYRLGLGDTTARDTLTQVGTSTDWAVVSAHSDSQLAIKTDGSLWGWGLNVYGELGGVGVLSLGEGESDDYSTPQQIGTDYDWATIEASRYGSFAVKTDGSLWCGGKNYDTRFTGALGSEVTEFTQIGTDTDWVSVAGSGGTEGWYAVAALKTNGTTWAVGSNAYSCLGDGQATSYTATTFEQIGTSSDWTALSSSSTCVYALKGQSGELYGWGQNSSGALGVGDTTPRDEPVSIAPSSSFLTLFDGVPPDMVLSIEAEAPSPEVAFDIAVDFTGFWTASIAVQPPVGIPDMDVEGGNAFSVSVRAVEPSLYVQVVAPFAVNVEAAAPTANFSFYRDIVWAFSIGAPAPSAAITLSHQPLDTFDTWAVNAAHGGHSVYTNYDFTNYFTLKGIQYGVLDGNIYALTGAKDIEADIVSEAIFGVSNLGTDKEKRVDSVYPVVVSSQTTEVSVSVAVDSGSKLEYSAPVAANATKPVRCKISRGMSGRYWQIGVSCAAEGKLEITSLRAVTVPLSRRV